MNPLHISLKTRALDVLAILSVAMLIACQEHKSSNSVTVPVDEATAEERVKISETLNDISKRAAKFGYNNKFDSLPVLVTTERIEDTGRLGYCSWDKNHKGQYIVINGESFEQDRKRPYLRGIFSILLHEIGHCYFARDHDQKILSKPGFHAKAEAYDAVGGSDFFENGFPLSIMYTGSECLGGGNCPEGSSAFGKVPEFGDYYVSELVGTVKPLSFDDVTKFKSFKWVEAD